MYNNINFFYDDPYLTVQESLKKKFKSNYKICTKCVFDNSVEGIKFNSEGVCSFCLGNQKDNNTKKKNINEVIDKIKSQKKGNYDCIVGLSGGVDSSFVAIMCKELGLNTLLVHFDNGWNTETACRNIEIIQKFTNFDLITHIVNWDEFKNLQMSFLKAGLTNFEAPSDHGIFASVYNIALKEKIKYIFTGVNSSTEAINVNTTNTKLKFWYGYLYHDLYHLISINRIFSKNNNLNTFPKISIFKRKFLEFLGKLRTVHLLNYMDYNKSDAIKKLKALGWNEYKNKHYESVITRFHQSFILPVKFGIDKRMWHLSSLIWSNQISRKDALLEIEKPICEEKILVQDYYFFLKKFGIDQKQFLEIIRSPNKEFSDYPNRYWLIKFMIDIKNKITLNDKN